MAWVSVFWGAARPSSLPLPKGQSEGLQGYNWVGLASPTSPFLVIILSLGSVYYLLCYRWGNCFLRRWDFDPRSHS